jgi:hypothetical protein
MKVIEVKLNFYKDTLHHDLIYYKPDYVITGEQGAVTIKETGITNIQVAHLPFFDSINVDLLCSFKVLFVKDGIVTAQLHLIE